MSLLLLPNLAVVKSQIHIHELLPNPVNVLVMRHSPRNEKEKQLTANMSDWPSSSSGIVGLQQDGSSGILGILNNIIAPRTGNIVESTQGQPLRSHLVTHFLQQNNNRIVRENSILGGNDLHSPKLPGQGNQRLRFSSLNPKSR